MGNGMGKGRNQGDNMQTFADKIKAYLGSENAKKQS
jgi:hypothetical protein